MLERAAQLAPWLQEFDAAHAVSAIDLAHHLALRRQDLRGLQQALSRLDVSSLGRAETHVLGSLHRLAGKPWTALRDSEPVGARRGPAELQRNARGLLGPPPDERGVRIRVTLPSDAAHGDELITSLVAAGMDIARINWAHDTADQWAELALRVRRAARHAGRPLRALQPRLVELDAGHLGLILEIETRRGFEHLPEMLLALGPGPRRAACSGLIQFCRRRVGRGGSAARSRFHSRANRGLRACDAARRWPLAMQAAADRPALPAASSRSSSPATSASLSPPSASCSSDRQAT